MPHVNRSHYWSGVQHAFDPVMCSSMAIGRPDVPRGAAPPAAASGPVDVGRKGIFGFDAYNGLALGQTTFARGARIRFAADKAAGVSVDGRELPGPQPIAGAVRLGPGDHLGLAPWAADRRHADLQGLRRPDRRRVPLLRRH